MPLFRAMLSGSFHGQLCQNVLHFATNASGDNDDMILAQSIATNWVDANIKFLVSESAFFSNVQVQRIDEPNHPPVVFPMSIRGRQIAGTEALGFSCFKIKLRGPGTGRAHRGRIYVWGLNPGALTDGFFRQTVMDQWRDMLNNLMVQYGPQAQTGYFLVISPRAQPTNYKSVVSMALAPIPGVQRRRNIGVGR